MSSGVTNTCFHPYTELRADYRFQLCHEVAEVKHIVTLITVIKHTRKLKRIPLNLFSCERVMSNNLKVLDSCLLPVAR